MHAALDLFRRERLAVEELHHEFLIRFGDHLHEFVLILRGFRFESCGDRRAFAVEGESFAGENVDITGHLAALHNRKLDGDDFAVLRGDGVDGGHEVRIFLVDGVDEYERRDSLFKTHFESFFRTDGESAGRAGHDYRAVRRGKSRHHLAFEVEKAGDVEDVDLDVVSHRIAERHADGYLALDLFVVIVHRGCAVVDFAESVDGLGHEKHRFGERGLAFSRVSDESDIADKIGCKSLHGIPLVDFSYQ